MWSPKGDRIAFIRKNGGDFQVFTIQLDGKGLKQLSEEKLELAKDFFDGN